MNVLFRCDGSHLIGMGHVIRCMALADAFTSSHKCRVEWAIKVDEAVLALLANKYRHSILPESSEDGSRMNSLARIIEDTATNILILDIKNEYSSEEITELKNTFGLLVVTIDDGEEKRNAADLAFYPPVPQLKESDWSHFNGQRFAGWEYLLLRSKFGDSNVEQNEKPFKIFISMGGSDPHLLSTRVMQIILGLDLSAEVSIIIGPHFTEDNRLPEIPKDSELLMHVHRTPERIWEIMARCHMAIATFGVTAYELLACGIPTVMLSISPDHALSAEKIHTAGCGISVGIHDAITDESLGGVILDLFGNKEKLQTMKEHCAGLVDGKGASRVASIIESCYKEKIASSSIN
jgi:spore coat polysaccharide biosynthesis predicted glycosyltransferase SpsG